jgi:hypothetical protein
MGALIAWMRNNYQWVFSGLGVFVISLLVGRRWVSKKVSTKGHMSPGKVGGDYKVTLNVRKTSGKN